LDREYFLNALSIQFISGTMQQVQDKMKNEYSSKYNFIMKG